MESLAQTLLHIREVQRLMGLAIRELSRRQDGHDATKLQSPELEIFDEWTPRLAGSTYGSPEYAAMLAAIKPALDHHYAHNSHHPEHYPTGIRGMTLVDVMEMICDWCAAAKRHNDGDVRRSIEVNQKRFGYSDELRDLLLNTVALLDTLPVPCPVSPANLRDFEHDAAQGDAGECSSVDVENKRETTGKDDRRSAPFGGTQ